MKGVSWEGRERGPWPKPMRPSDSAKVPWLSRPQPNAMWGVAGVEEEEGLTRVRVSEESSPRVEDPSP